MAGKKKDADVRGEQHVEQGRHVDQTVSDEEHLAYWQEKLYQLPTLDLPHDHPRPPVQTHHGQRHSTSLPAELVKGLQAVGDAEQATLFMTMLAAFQVVLYQYSGQTDIVLGTVPVACDPDVGNRLLVLRTDLSDTSTFRDLLRRVREVCVEAYAHQNVPFGRLVEELQGASDSSRMPLCQVLFHMQDELERAAEQSTPTSPFDLVVNVFRSDDVHLHQVEFVYNEHLFEADTMERMVNHYLMLLQGVVDDPEQQIAELPLLTAKEHQQLIFEFNDTVAEYPQACLHELFEEQVEKQPDALAVIFEEDRLTYAELNARVNQLAHYLRSY
ncbi:MAG: condensation domain-containing protein, partial [Tumebacillaceae bacterium]